MSEQTVDTVVDVSTRADDTRENQPVAPKKVRGRPITKETAKVFQLSSTQAKRRRKEARLKMLDALTGQDVALGDELKKALKNGDEVKIRCIREAISMVGLHWDQSDEGREQRFKGSINSTAKVDSNASVKLVIEDLTKPLE
jgi:hypothetical protein